MASTPKLPSPAEVKGGKKPARKPGKKSTSARIRKGAAKMLKGRMPQFKQAGIMFGEVAGSAAAASAVAGYMSAKGKDIKIMGKVDGRLVAGVAALVASMWKAGHTNHHLLNIGAGALTSYATEYARDKAYAFGAKASAAPAPKAPGTDGVGGVVIGQVGAADYRSQRIAAKIGRLQQRRLAEQAADAEGVHGYDYAYAR